MSPQYTSEFEALIASANHRASIEERLALTEIERDALRVKVARAFGQSEPIITDKSVYA